jgi:hypothetical protein
MKIEDVIQYWIDTAENDLNFARDNLIKIKEMYSWLKQNLL